MIPFVFFRAAKMHFSQKELPSPLPKLHIKTWRLLPYWRKLFIGPPIIFQNFSFLDNIKNQWLKLTKKSYCKLYFRRRTLTLLFYYGDIICRDWCNAMAKLQALHKNATWFILFFPRVLLRAMHLGGSSVEVIHEHFAIFRTLDLSI